MPSPFLSSEEYDERAHQLYNEGLYDEALDVLREGLSLYPNAVELHIGVGYARMAREEYAWARRSFEEALVLEPEHEDALAGLGETLLKFGQEDAAVRCFRRILELGYSDDLDLVLQAGRALFREASLRDRRPLFEVAQDFFVAAVTQAPEMAEAHACIGYTMHRLGDDQGAVESLQAALQFDPEHAEARIYLANVLYDRGEYEPALYHFEQTRPEDHWDELGLWRVIELKQAAYKLGDEDPELKPWRDRVDELTDELDDIDEMLMELDPEDGQAPEPDAGAHKQLEMFGALLDTLRAKDSSAHQVVAQDGRAYMGSWEEIVTGLRDAEGDAATPTLEEYMRRAAVRARTQLGVDLPSHDAESFLRASANAGLLRILR